MMCWMGPWEPAVCPWAAGGGSHILAITKYASQSFLLRELVYQHKPDKPVIPVPTFNSFDTSCSENSRLEAGEVPLTVSVHPEK